MNILPCEYGEKLQPQTTSVNSKTTLSREKVSKDEEHQQTHKIQASRRRNVKVQPQPFILPALCTEVFSEKVDVTSGASICSEDSKM